MIVLRGALTITGVIAWGKAVRARDQAIRLLLAAKRYRQEGLDLHQAAVERNDRAIACQHDANRKLDAARALVREHTS